MELLIIKNNTDYFRFKKVTVLRCAICRTDAKMWDQGHRDLVFPRVLGHEMVVADAHGQRYIVWPGKSCRTCGFCKTGRENLCEEMKITGFHHDGGFAGQALLPADSAGTHAKHSFRKISQIYY